MRKTVFNISIIVVLCCLARLSYGFQFDIQQDNKYQNSTSIKETQCNIQTQIDFFFSSQTKLFCSTSSCSLTNPTNSTIKFLDINGDLLQLILSDAVYTIQKLQKNQVGGSNTRYFTFTFSNQNNVNQKVYVVVPVTSGISSNNPRILNIPALNQTDKNQFTSLNSLTNLDNGLQLSAFNFLNQIDYSRFYHASNSQLTKTILLSIYTFETKFMIEGSLDTSQISDIEIDYQNTGNKLCFGSQQASGIFQTHLRESWPLWTAWFAILFYWLFYLISDSNRNECFDKHFNKNKLTCWPFYSVFYLANQQFFTRLSRITLMLINFTIQGVILAALFLTLGPSNDPLMILWAGIIAAACSHFVPYFFGCVFLSPAYSLTIQKFRILKRAKSTAVKQQNQQQVYEEEVDKLEQKIFSRYYWFYVICVALYLALWTVSVHLLKQLDRKYYTQQHYWVSALAVAFVLENVIFQQLFAYLFGKRRFYQKRGFFYEFEMGEEYKQIEQ